MLGPASRETTLPYVLTQDIDIAVEVSALGYVKKSI
jgi:hypothetical protein